MGKPSHKVYNKSNYKNASLMKSKTVGDSFTGHGFAQSRKNKCMKKYKKMMKKRPWKDTESKDQRSAYKTKHKTLNDFSSTRKEYQLEKEAKEQQIKEIQEEKQRKKEMVMKNIKKRKQLSTALRKRTKKGQPVMKSQIEYILDRIGGTK